MIIASFIVPTNLKLTQTRLVCQSPGLVIMAASSQKRSFCPCCHKSSKSIHSRYERILSDLPVSGKEVKVIIESRKFFCKNGKCKRKIFTERFGSEIGPYRRCFDRYVKLVGKLGLELGGNKGSAICKAIGYPASPSSVLRTVKQIPLPPNIKTSGTIGVDDWAYKKGRNYGTIIVDLESRKVVDLLPDREAGTLARWLGTHPEVHTVSRDRASAYSLGVRNGAPQAVQVSDRFHLLVNLRDAFQKMLYKQSKVLRESFNEYSNPDQKEVLAEELPVLPGSPSITGTQVIGNISSERQFKFEKAKELHQQGYKVKTIARILQAGNKTVRKYIQLDILPSRQSPVNSSQETNFNRFRSQLIEGFLPEVTYKSLYQSIQQQGFNGKYTQFCENMNRLVKVKTSSDTAKLKRGNLPKLAPIQTWSTSKLAFMALGKENKLKSKDQEFLDFLYNKSPEIKAAADLALRFKELFQNKTEGSLDSWLQDALLPESQLKGFAKGIKGDFEAVNQAVISSISNGQVEGQVNRLKNIKRRMYGRASFQLLRKIVLFNSG